MQWLVTGASGFVGRRLVSRLVELGHQVRITSRDPKGVAENLRDKCIRWSPMTEVLPSSALEGVDCVVHLVGEDVAGKRWSTDQKQRIRDSRVLGTRNLVGGVRGASRRVRLISSSAIGFYGDRGDESLDEASLRGQGFLAELCGDWEREARGAEASAIVSIVRIGNVLAAQGGMMAKLLPIFRSGFGGPVGSGNQWISWIHREDLVGLFIRLGEQEVGGTYNAVSPQPVTNREFAKVLAKTLGRPGIVPLPEAVARISLGERADLILGSQRAGSRVLSGLDFKFQFPSLERALEEICLVR